MLARSTQNIGCVDSKNNIGIAVDDLASQNDVDANWIRVARQKMRDAPIDYFQVKAHRYWIDFLVSLVCAYTAATVFLMAPLGSLTTPEMEELSDWAKTASADEKTKAIRARYLMATPDVEISKHGRAGKVR